ncbi:heme biosynthesis HemY N-terminal domain-containing protein [Phenylobacterium sp.]|uniref:heme biosynthesis HemY N-terminal domain-containing protein n=1 Tax=Phenylobacterium sp. TaxID=1871053 RepID=UPI0025E34E19|nr:heme biosynthesis HemY N-terminal domain-containing protein [Phenylobacterium sp.]MCA3719844.1 heme biosynthesis protein HemY [Phenylobacterium sp.]
MIRSALILILISLAAAIVLSLAGESGRASIVWLGWRADMTAAALLLIILLASLLAFAAWRLVLWVADAPRRAAAARAETRRRQELEVLTRGFTAVAAGDVAEARRLAAKAADLTAEAPALARLLSAHAAEAAEDSAAAEAAWTAMLAFPDLRLAARRGLTTLALNRGDRASAVQHAEAAFALARTARWAWRVLLEARLEASDWEAARDLLKTGQERRIVSPEVAERGRAALLAASAAQLDLTGDARARSRAADFALEAARLQPGFAPGVVMAARLLAAQGKAGRAAQVIETAWKAAPHPALWMALRDLKTRETPRERAGRLAALAALNPGARESRILMVEAALTGGDGDRAQDLARALESEPLTARIAGLMARTAFAAGRPDEARVWRGRGISAPGEADWSDLDPEGRAFAYQPGDWARLAVSFAETGELIHPRHERREPGLSDLPDLPMSYAEQDFTALEAPAPFPIGEGLQGEEEEEPETAPPPVAPPPARRRLARTPRDAK